jgi:hypothetical protein
MLARVYAICVYYDMYVVYLTRMVNVAGRDAPGLDAWNGTAFPLLPLARV